MNERTHETLVASLKCSSGGEHGPPGSVPPPHKPSAPHLALKVVEGAGEELSQQVWCELTHSLHQSQGEGHGDAFLGDVLQGHALPHDPGHLPGEVAFPLLKIRTQQGS